MSLGDVKLNLKDWEHVSSGKDTTTLQHKKNKHTLTISHQALSPKFKTQLETLANSARTPEQADEEKHQDAKMAKGGEVNPTLQQSKVRGVAGGLSPKLNPSTAANVAPLTGAYAKGGKVPHYADGTGFVSDLESAATNLGNKINDVFGTKGQKQDYSDSQMYKNTAKQNSPDRPNDDPSRAKHPSGSEEGRKFYDTGGFVTDLETAAANLGTKIKKAVGAGEVTQDYSEDAGYKKPGDTKTAPPSRPNADPSKARHPEGSEEGRTFFEGGGMAKVPDTSSDSDSSDDTPDAPDEPMIQIPLSEAKALHEAVKTKTEPVSKFEEAKGAPPEPTPYSGESIVKRISDEVVKNLTPGGALPQQPSPMPAEQAPEPQAQDQQPSPMTTPAPSQDEAQAAQAAAQQAQASRAPATSSVEPSYEQTIQNAYKQQVLGQQQLAEARTAEGETKAKGIEPIIDAEQAAVTQFKQDTHDIDAENKHFMDDIKAKYIDPDQYWKDHADLITGKQVSGHSKLANIMGMLVSGFGGSQGLKNFNDMTQYEINNNIEAQRQNLTSANNLLRANLERYRNVKDAFDATRLQYGVMVNHYGELAAAKAATPAAKAQMNLALSDFNAKYMAPLTMQLGIRRAFANLNNSNNPDAIASGINLLRASPGGEKMAEDMTARFVPGIGLASNPVPQPVRDRITAHQDMNRIIDKVSNFNKLHPNAQMSIKDRAEAQTLMSELQSSVRTAEDQGVFKKSDAEFLNGEIGKGPASFFHAWNTDPHIKQLKEIKQADYQNLLKNAGLPIPKPVEPEARKYAPGDTLYVKGQKVRIIDDKGNYTPVK